MCVLPSADGSTDPLIWNKHCCGVPPGTLNSAYQHRPFILTLIIRSADEQLIESVNSKKSRSFNYVPAPIVYTDAVTSAIRNIHSRSRLTQRYHSELVPSSHLESVSWVKVSPVYQLCWDSVFKISYTYQVVTVKLFGRSSFRISDGTSNNLTEVLVDSHSPSKQIPRKYFE